MRLDGLTTLRFFAAFSIFLHHSSVFGIRFSEYLNGFNLGGAVSFFYVLSGFVLSYSRDGKLATRRDMSNFAIERWFRLWPLHVVCGVLVMLTLSASGSFEQYYLFFTLQHAWIPAYSTAFFLNAVSWSISVEIFFYLMFPLIFCLGTRAIVLVAIVWTLAVYGLMTAVSWYPQAFPFTPLTADIMKPGVTEASFFYFFPPIRMPEFLWGMVVYQAYKRIRLSDRSATIGQGIATVLALTSPLWFLPSGIAMWHVLPTTALNMYWHYGIWPFYCFVVFVFAYQSGWIARAISHPWLVYLGEISFSLYMIHQIVISNLMQNVGAGTWGLPLLGIMVALVISIAMSSLLFHTVEGPPRQWIKARLSRAERTPPLARTARTDIG